MKKQKIIIVFALGLLFANGAFAQSNKFKFGILGGANFSNIDANDTENNKAHVGFNFGVFTRIPLTKSFAIQPEVYFTTKGSEMTYQNGTVDGTANFDLSYIEIPVLMVFNVTDNINFHVGPYFSYLVDSKVQNVSDVNFYDFESNIDSNDFNDFDTGIVAGFGVDVKSFGFGVRYNFGLITVGKEKTYLGTNYVFPDGKNGVINLYLNYSIL
jgi:hypothetical protein